MEKNQRKEGYVEKFRGEREMWRKIRGEMEMWRKIRGEREMWRKIRGEREMWRKIRGEREMWKKIQRKEGNVEKKLLTLSCPLQKSAKYLGNLKMRKIKSLILTPAHTDRGVFRGRVLKILPPPQKKVE